MIQSSHRNEWFITVLVIICSAILLASLAVAIGGNPFRSNSRTVRVVFPDITGIRVNSPVKYAGANAGTVTAVRMLTLEERATLPDPSHSIEVTLALDTDVPVLTQGVHASLAANTILAEKFVLLTPGPATAAPIADSELLVGIAPTTIDALSAEVATSLASLRKAVTGLGGGAVGTLFADLPALMEQLAATLTQTQTLIGHADTLVNDGIQVIKRGDTLVTDTSGVVHRVGDLVEHTQPSIEKLFADLQSAANTLDQFAARAEKLIQTNEKPINRTTTQLERAVIDLRITSAHAKTLAESLVRRPQQIIWGTRREPNQLSSEAEILAD